MFAFLLGVVMFAAAEPPMHAVVVQSDEPRVMVFRTTAEPPDGSAAPRRIIIRNEAAPALPQVWIGVRIAPLPAALAAHVGDRGVMIANVAVDGPADKAGFQQYDIVLKYNDQDISAPPDLTAAIGKGQAGQPATLTILRKGQPQTVQLTPVKPDPNLEMKMKYEEPAESFVDSGMKLRGRALERGPGGNLIFRDLGELKNMPDILKELEVELGQPGEPPEQWEVEVDDGEHAAQGAGTRVKVETRIRADDQGGKLEITRENDGPITVTRTDKDGKQTTATYDTPEALEKADTEAYQMFTEHLAPAGVHLFHVGPAGPGADQWRKQFQIEVHEKLRDALDRAKEAQDKAAEHAGEAMRKAEEALAKAHVEIRRHVEPAAPAPTAAKPEALVVSVHDDGSLKVRVREDGETRIMLFKNVAEFQKAEPELYAQAQEFLK
jgi:hypothetical protein